MKVEEKPIEMQEETFGSFWSIQICEWKVEEIEKRMLEIQKNIIITKI